MMAEAAEYLKGRHDFAAFQAAGSTVRSSERQLFESGVCTGPPLVLADLAFVAGCSAGSASLADRSRPDDTSKRSLRPSWPGFDSGASRFGYQTLSPLIVYHVTGDGFLRHMVRTIVGSLVEIGRGRRPAAWMREILEKRDRTRSGPTAPPQGLILVSVEYGTGPEAEPSLASEG
jgi:tRNA U38,U39,U40 pseudouridine synthase TruA